MMSLSSAKEYIRDVSLLLCGLLLLSSCSTSPEIPQSELNGIWQWTSSSGGWGGVVADSVGYSQSLLIDLGLGEAVLFKNNEVKTRYSTKWESSDIDGSKHWYLYPQNTESQIPYRLDEISEDEILLRPNCDDCMSHYFKR